MRAIDLRAQADRRVNDAVTEGLEQLAKGWRPARVVGILRDAARVVADLRQQADRAWLLETACKQASPWSPNLHCYLSGGHPGHHLYSVKAGWVA